MVHLTCKSDKLAVTWLEGYVYAYIYIFFFFAIIDPLVHQSHTGSSIYSSGLAPQRTATSVSTHMGCMTLFQNLLRSIHSVLLLP